MPIAVAGEKPIKRTQGLELLIGNQSILEVTGMLLQRLLVEDEGQTLVEYGLLVALIALVVIAALTLLGRRIANTFNQINNTLPG